MKELTGATATLFVRRGDQFIRVSTNVANAERQPRHRHAARPRRQGLRGRQRGTAFYGLVEILGEPYVTGYEPIADARGATVGVWYVGYPIAQMRSLQENIRKARFLDGGFVALVDAKGKVRRALRAPVRQTSPGPGGPGGDAGRPLAGERRLRSRPGATGSSPAIRSAT